MLGLGLCVGFSMVRVPKIPVLSEIFSAEVGERPKWPKQITFQVVSVMRNINQGDVTEREGSGVVR